MNIFTLLIYAHYAHTQAEKGRDGQRIIACLNNVPVSAHIYSERSGTGISGQSVVSRPQTMLLNCTLHCTLHILHILSLQRPVRQELEHDRKKMIRNLLYTACLDAQQHQQPN